MIMIRVMVRVVIKVRAMVTVKVNPTKHPYHQRLKIVSCKMSIIY